MKNVTDLFVEAQELQRDQCLKIACDAHFSNFPAVRDKYFERADMFGKRIRMEKQCQK